MNSQLLTLISEENRANLLNLPQITVLPDDQKTQALNDILEQILDSVLVRLSQSLTESDMQKLEEMASSEQESSETVKYFLQSKVPNLDEIIKEEVTSYQTS